MEADLQFCSAENTDDAVTTLHSGFYSYIILLTYFINVCLYIDHSLLSYIFMSLPLPC